MPRLAIMGSTRQLARAEWQEYFDRFTAALLDEDTPESATVEVLSARRGDQIEFSAVRLFGLAYDPKSQAFQVLLEDVDHLVFHPTEIWVLEGENDSVTIEVIDAGGRKEIIYVSRTGAPALRDGPTPDANSSR
jgi:hypothetical protein